MHRLSLTLVVKRIFFIAVLLFLTGANVYAETWRIGVLAFRGNDNAFDRWQATANYLGKSVAPEHFEIVPLSLDEVETAISNGSIDFILTNTGNYVEMEVAHGVSRIATMKNSFAGKIFTRFGAVIFTRADRKTINSLKDLRGQRFQAVDENGFGGFRMAWRELKHQGVDPYSDFSELKFNGFPQDDVVYAVIDGRADAGTVRADVLLMMESEGKFNLADIKILNVQSYPDYPINSSTPLYPSWPFSKLSHTPPEIAERVAAALLQMTQESAAAKSAGIAGWTIPLDYQPVHELLMDLQVGPYENLRHLNWALVLEKYGPIVALLMLSFVVLTYLTLSLGAANKKLRATDLELRLHRDKLAEMVQGATIDIVKARDQALNASEAKSHFLASMSHELRSPLRAINTQASQVREIAAEHNLTTCCAHLDNIAIASTHLLQLIDDLLDLTLTETGSLSLELQPADVELLIKDIIDPFRDIAKKQHNTLTLNIAENLGSINVDVHRVSKVLNNVVSNACKFTCNGEIKFDARVDRRAHQEFVRFTISDSGKGIAENAKTAIFEPFKSAEIHDGTEGLGVGLAIAKAYCERMGGDISVKSTAGIGTEVSISLPRDARRFNLTPVVRRAQSMSAATDVVA